MTMTQMDGNRCAVEFIHGLRLEAVPSEVVRQARICLLDLLGACLAGADAKGARILLDFAATQMAGPEEATVIRARCKLPRTAAALVNGFIANALDIDDGYRPVKGHPGAAVFPAVLAAAEHAGADGKALLETLIVGYEVAIRTGTILHGHYGFYHGSGSWGAVGSAAGVARLMGLSPERTGHAMGIAESYAPLIPEIRAVEHPRMAPKDGIAWGGMVGMSAALLAAGGYTGMPSLLGDPERNADVFTLGREYRMMHLYFKPYPCCRWAQPAIDGLRKIMAREGLTPERIARIRIRSFAEAVKLCKMPPATLEEAEYNVLYPVAVTALHGEFTPQHLREEHYGRPDIKAMMALTEITADSAIQARFPQECLSEVEVMTTEGAVFASGLVAAKGDFDYPLSGEELREKFRLITRGILDGDQALNLLEAVDRIEERKVGDLVRFLA
jgi:2-methylcitrate dehydratase PrpD